MEDIARTLADQLVKADQLARLGEARKVMALAELASNYHLGLDDVVEVLAEKQVPVGDGAPSVSEYLCLEVAGLLGCPPSAAAGKIADAVNLRHRHPTLYRAMIELQIGADRACRAAHKCQDLPADVAEEVTAKWLRVQHRFGWTAAFNRLEKLVIDADPARAAAKERRQRKQLGVHVWGPYEGTMNLTGRLETLDAKYLDAAVDRLADILESEAPELTKETLRAKALGALANPAYALALLQRAAQPSLVDADATAPSDADAAAGLRRPDQHGCRGHLCGTITTPLHKLRPQLGIAVHLHVDALGDLEGAARIEGAGHLTLDSLSEMLRGVEVKVQPVIDLGDVPPEDQYVPSISMKQAVSLAAQHELFLYSNRTSRGLDLDHTRPYRPRTRGQTRVGNLAPISRRVHRAKTAGIWKVEQPKSLVLVWTSPLGYRYEVHPREGTRRVVEDCAA